MKDLLKKIPLHYILAFIVFLATLILLFSCSYFEKLPEDSLLEELVEDVIEHYTGIDVDLTPNSKEK